MKRRICDKLIPPGSHWGMLGVVTLLFVLVALFVDLRPVVDENFFFSTIDPGVRQTKKIEQHFPSKPQLILTVSSRDISSSRYLERIQKLTHRLDEIDGVTSVKSLTAGPKSFQDAVASPFWSRLLISKDRKASNLIVFVLDKDTEKLIKRIELVIHETDDKDIRIHVTDHPA